MEERSGGCCEAGAPDDALVLAFADPAVADSWAEILNADGMAVAFDRVVVSGWDSPNGSALLAQLIERTEHRRLVICLGAGSAGYADLMFGRLLGACAILALGPSSGPDRPDLEDLRILFDSPDLDLPFQRVEVIETDDRAEGEDALVMAISGNGARVRSWAARLPAPAAFQAIVQTAWLKAWLEAAIEDGETPAPLISRQSNRTQPSGDAHHAV
jgi:hypothetical protein